MPSGEEVISIDPDQMDAIVKSRAFFDKYRNGIGKRILYEVQLHDPIAVEYDCSPEQFEDILRHIESVWTRLGEDDAHWSVVSTPDFRAARINDTMQQFYESGRVEVENLKRLMARVGADLSHAEIALEYGCGVGRVTRWLAAMFPRVIGVDVSTNHLRLAQACFASRDVRNVETIKITRFSDVENLPRFDFFYSKIVLQHNPPPVIHRTFDVLCSKLNPGGVGVAQIPTYCKNYNFRLDSYLISMNEVEGMEMHVLPQYAVFDLMEKNNCRVREVFRDHLVTNMDFVSSTFVFEKK